VPLDRAGTPGQGHTGFDGLVVLLEPARKALEGPQRTGRRAREPGIEALRLPLADEGCKVLREVNRLGDLGRLRVELGELLGLGRRALLGASQASHVARRGVKGWATGSATTGRRWRRPWRRGGMPWAWRMRLTEAVTRR